MTTLEYIEELGGWIEVLPATEANPFLKSSHRRSTRKACGYTKRQIRRMTRNDHHRFILALEIHRPRGPRSFF